MQVAKWGNSLAVRIPADVVRALGLKEGDQIELCPLDAGQFAVMSDKQRHEAAMERMKQFGGWMPADYSFDRNEANAR